MAISDRQLLDLLSRPPFVDSAELALILGEPHATVHRALTSLLAILTSVRSRSHRWVALRLNSVNHAIGQIRDWRQWLMDNIDYARRPKEQNGLGLVGIDPSVPGLIVIGRRQKYSSRYNEFRRQLIDPERIVIHSYDWLVDGANINYSGWLTGELRGLA